MLFVQGQSTGCVVFFLFIFLQCTDQWADDLPMYVLHLNTGVRLHHLLEAWSIIDEGGDWEKTPLVTRIRSLFERDTAGRQAEVQERGYSLEAELNFLKVCM